MIGGIQEQLQAMIDKANGPGTLNIQRVQLWDLFCHEPFYNDSNLAAQTQDLFTHKSGDTTTAFNGGAGSPQYRFTVADTNLKSPGNTPYDLFIHGLSLDILARQHTSGTQGAVNDLSQFQVSKAAMLTDIYALFKINQLEVDQLTWVEAPAASGAYGYAAYGTTGALTTAFFVGNAANGMPLADNFKSYAAEGPFFCKANSEISMQATYGSSMLAANFIFKPANTGAPVLFLKATLRAFRVWWAQ